MATPLEDIEKGVETCDWKKVVRGYNKLTGKKLKSPTRVVPAEIKAEDVPDAIRLLFCCEAVEDLADDLVDFIREKKEAAKNQVFSPPDETEEDARESRSDSEEEDDSEEWVAPQEENAPLARCSPEEVSNPFHIDHAANRAASGTQAVTEEDESGGKRPCRVEPFKPGMVNLFKDDRSLDKELIKADKKLAGKIKPTERRPPKSQKKIKVTCWKCERSVTVDEDEAPATIGGERALYTCANCVGGTRGR